MPMWRPGRYRRIVGAVLGPTSVTASIVSDDIRLDWISSTSPISWNVQVFVNIFGSGHFSLVRNATLAGNVRQYNPAFGLDSGDAAYGIVVGTFSSGSGPSVQSATVTEP